MILTYDCLGHGSLNLTAALEASLLTVWTTLSAHRRDASSCARAALPSFRLERKRNNVVGAAHRAWNHGGCSSARLHMIGHLTNGSISAACECAAYRRTATCGVVRCDSEGRVHNLPTAAPVLSRCGSFRLKCTAACLIFQQAHSRPPSTTGS